MTISGEKKEEEKIGVPKSEEAKAKEKKITIQ
jgi:hypothetical protein